MNGLKCVGCKIKDAKLIEGRTFGIVRVNRKYLHPFDKSEKHICV